MMMLMILLVCVCVCDEGTIPWEVLHDFVQNHALRKIKLGNNNFDGVSSGIPSLISAMTKLEELSLHSLGFTGMYTVITSDRSKCIRCRQCWRFQQQYRSHASLFAPKQAYR